MTLTGKIIDIQHSDKVSTVIVETDGQYPKKVALKMFGKVKDTFSLGIGDDIKAEIDVESREYNGKWYTDAKMWKYE
jgi:hypothetical protein